MHDSRTDRMMHTGHGQQQRKQKAAASGLIISPPPASVSLARHSYSRHFHTAKSPPLTPITGSSTCSVHSRGQDNATGLHRSFELEVRLEQEPEDCIYTTDSPYAALQSARYDQTCFERPTWRTPPSLSASESSTAGSPTLGSFSLRLDTRDESVLPELPAFELESLRKEFGSASPSQSELGITESPARRSQQYGDIYISLDGVSEPPKSPFYVQPHQVKRQSPLSLSHVPILLDERPMATTIKVRAPPVSPSPVPRKTSGSKATPKRELLPSALSDFANRELPAVPGGRPYKPQRLFGAKPVLQQETEELDLSFAEMPVSYRRPSMSSVSPGIPVSPVRSVREDIPVLFACPTPPGKSPSRNKGVMTESSKYVGTDHSAGLKPSRLYDMI
ncbi:hypothetical protein BCR37DRAFT_389974 [Protomyces lactucae-debilis]|uniref:Uncharacterized protein n=1 Tax=Protomyces lactucae-debilis TaxID=2754530 RepID=A0A1Y2ESS6_PROLT|nr:uncharacterized protein BCR37DRAFT_389974 [Protomyces lactucae-debilis]ORY73895.1 hypothetical protein BCR37DRAFT_389974 [Protomyces lactucae-debilis]